MFTYQCHHSYQYGNASSQLHQLKPHITYQETSPTLCKQQTLLSAFPYSVLQCCSESIPALFNRLMDWSRKTVEAVQQNLLNMRQHTCGSSRRARPRGDAHSLTLGSPSLKRAITRSICPYNTCTERRQHTIHLFDTASISHHMTHCKQLLAGLIEVQQER
jgi:hypothetical protein